MDILPVKDGRIAEHWSVVDRLDLFRQLGLVQGARDAGTGKLE